MSHANTVALHDDLMHVTGILFCLCGTRAATPDALREHQLVCTRTMRARRRLAPLIVAKIRALQARL